MISQVSLNVMALSKSLDLLDIVNLKDRLATGFEEECHENGPLRVRVNTAARAALLECSEKERRALRWAAIGRRTQISAVLGHMGVLGRHGEDIEVSRAHQFFLNARGSNVHEITIIKV